MEKKKDKKQEIMEKPLPEVLDNLESGVNRAVRIAKKAERTAKESAASNQSVETEPKAEKSADPPSPKPRKKREWPVFFRTVGCQFRQHRCCLGWALFALVLVILISFLVFSKPQEVVQTEAPPEPATTEITVPSEPVIKEVVPKSVLDELESLRDKLEGAGDELKDVKNERDDLKGEISRMIAAAVIPEIIGKTDIVGTITGRQTIDLIGTSCPKTSTAGGLKAVEFNEADLVPESVFNAWLAQDKTENENLGNSWNYIAALEYKLRLQPGGQNIPFNRARRGGETLAAVVLYDETVGAARLYVFSPLNEEGIKKIDPANPDQIIEYVHLD